MLSSGLQGLRKGMLPGQVTGGMLGHGRSLFMLLSEVKCTTAKRSTTDLVFLLLV